MNELIKIEKAKLMKKGAYQSGTGEYGPWRRINLKVEWKYMCKDAEGQPKECSQSAVVVAKGDNADWAKDLNVGNAYLHTPDTYLNIVVRMEGKLYERPKKDGSGTWEDVENQLTVVQIEIAAIE